MQAAQLLFSGTPRPHLFTHFPYTTLFRSVAISYLVRRLEEGSSQENFMSAVFELDDPAVFEREAERFRDRKSTRLNSSHVAISYAVFCLTKNRSVPPNQSEYAQHHKSVPT